MFPAGQGTWVQKSTLFLSEHACYNTCVSVEIAMKEKATSKTVLQTLIAEMKKPHVTSSGKASLEALVKSQKTLTKAKK